MGPAALLSSLGVLMAPVALSGSPYSFHITSWNVTQTYGKAGFTLSFSNCASFVLPDFLSRSASESHAATFARPFGQDGKNSGRSDAIHNLASSCSFISATYSDAVCSKNRMFTVGKANKETGTEVDTSD